MNATSEPGQFTPELLAQSLALPLIARERFAELCGVSDGVVQGWIARGYLPVYEIGKYRLVNLTLLHQMALNKAPWL
ncbi:MAG: hypothetical protein V4443_12220 [Pseudomonadota bacterium]